MMGRISPREAELYMGIIRTIYDQDVPALTQTLLALGRYDRAPDQQALTERIGIFLHKYESMPMADMDMGVLVDEFVQILNEVRRVRARLADDARAQPARHSGACSRACRRTRTSSRSWRSTSRTPP